MAACSWESCILASALALAPGLAFAGGGIAFGGGVASADLPTGGSESGSSLQLSGTMHFGPAQDDDFGMSWFVGASYQKTSGAKLPDYGGTDFDEMQIPIGMTIRIKRVGISLYGGQQWTYIDTELGRSKADYFVIGGRLRVPFGPAGTVPGRFALVGTYAQGGGGFVDPDRNAPDGSLVVLEEDVDMTDTRLALDYAINGHWLARLEHRLVEYDGKTSPLFQQKFNSTMLVIGYNF